MVGGETCLQTASICEQNSAPRHTHTTRHPHSRHRTHHRTHARITKAVNTTRIHTYIRVALQNKRTYCQEQMQTQTFLPKIASNRTVNKKRQRLFWEGHITGTTMPAQIGAAKFPNLNHMCRRQPHSSHHMRETAK